MFPLVTYLRKYQFEDHSSYAAAQGGRTKVVSFLRRIDEKKKKSLKSFFLTQIFFPTQTAGKASSDFCGFSVLDTADGLRIKSVGQVKSSADTLTILPVANLAQDEEVHMVRKKDNSA